jgi:hypothetical protein
MVRTILGPFRRQLSSLLPLGMQFLAHRIPGMAPQHAEILQVFAFMERYFGWVKSMIGDTNGSTSFE